MLQSNAFNFEFDLFWPLVYQYHVTFSFNAVSHNVYVISCFIGGEVTLQLQQLLVLVVAKQNPQRASPSHSQTPQYVICGSAGLATRFSNAQLFPAQSKYSPLILTFSIFAELRVVLCWD